jgi:4-amino-4-deoxy-L-arabinose transferase-like glycosyltransferase
MSVEETTTASGSETADPEKPADPRKKRIWGTLALIVLLGLVLRLWGIGWSLPDARHPLATYHPDELVNLNAASNADIAQGKIDIQFYNYGAFYFYLVSFGHTFGRGWGLIPSTPPWPEDKPPLSDSEERARAAPERAALFLTGRLITALLGTATILVLFALGDRLFGWRTGLMSALLYALTPLAVVHAHFLTVDVPATLFVSLTLLWAARLLTRPTWRDYALAGVWAGLAAATKYNTGLVLIAPLVAHVLNRPRAAGADRSPFSLAGRREGDEGRNLQRVLSVGVLLGSALLAFLIACPGPWLNPDYFWNGIPGYPGSGVRY